jgi:hypothetical protein
MLSGRGKIGGVVHGHSKWEDAMQIKRELSQLVTDLHEAYKNNNNMVLPQQGTYTPGATCHTA